MKKLLLLSSIAFLFTACASLFEPRFGKICIQLKKDSLDYTIRTVKPDTFLNTNAIDWYDYYFLNYLEEALENRGYQFDSRNCATWFVLQKGGTDLVGTGLRELPTTDGPVKLRFLKSDSRFLLEGKQKVILPICDSIPENYNYFPVAQGETLPTWVWPKEHLVMRSPNYAWLPLGFNKHHIMNLAYKMANQTAKSIDSYIIQQINTDKELYRKIYNP